MMRTSFGSSSVKQPSRLDRKKKGVNPNWPLGFSTKTENAFNVQKSQKVTRDANSAGKVLVRQTTVEGTLSDGHAHNQRAIRYALR